ncbi:hypothetical protein K4F52_002149 [Lecanicillium sp. MT-2017a]|nr:hypothetical protein K4F52_002149 [Lecanicillium sp. MT-2017a]
MSVASASSRASIDSDELQVLPLPTPARVHHSSSRPSPQPPRYRSTTVGRHPTTTAPDTASSPHNAAAAGSQTSSSRQQHHASAHASATQTSSSPAARASPSTPSSSSRRHRRQQRQQSPSYWASRQLLNESNAPLLWEQDTVSHTQTARNDPAVIHDDADEQFISLFVDEFSSPSSYPSFTNHPTTNETAQTRQSRTQTHANSHPYSSPARPATTASYRPSSTSSAFDPPLRSITQLSASSADSRPSILIDDLVDDEGLTESTSSSSSFSENMPAVTTRRNPASLPDAQHHHRAKRQRTANSKPPQQPKDEIFLNSDDSLFGDSPTQPPAVVENDIVPAEDLATIDLTEATEVPDELRRPEVDNRIKISAFQCAICMDDVTALTVTHCGHLFCKQCLHSSLQVETTKGKCPMCRAKIDIKARQAYTTKTKGYWPLELKLMTATRKGKRKVDNIS